MTTILPEGTQIANTYQLLSVLGTGASSVVYQARHLVLDRDVAIKILKEHYDETALARFQQEARTASALEHPNIVKILASGLNDDAPYLVMELVHGETLADRISRAKHLSPAECLDIFSQILAGLEYLHRENVLHRDLKPQNILLSKNSEGQTLAKLSDFGIAQGIIEDGSSPSLTRTNEIVGSPAYMSPEQCQKKTLDERSDIYSLGCIMFESMSGMPPFNSDNQLDLMYKHLHEAPKLLAEMELTAPVPIQLSQIIAKCLEKDRDNRWVNCTALRKALQEADLSSRLNKRTELSHVRKEALVIVAAISILLGLALFLILKNKHGQGLSPSGKSSGVGSLAMSSPAKLLSEFEEALRKDDLYTAHRLEKELVTKMSAESNEAASKSIQQMEWQARRGHFFELRNNLEESLKYNQKALQLSKIVKPTDMSAYSSQNMRSQAYLHTQMQNWNVAKSIIDQGWITYADKQNWDIARAAYNFATGNYEAAYDYYQSQMPRIIASVERDPHSVTNLVFLCDRLNSNGLCEIEFEQFDSARKGVEKMVQLFDKAKAIGNKRELRISPAVIGEIATTYFALAEKTNNKARLSDRKNAKRYAKNIIQWMQKNGIKVSRTESNALKILARCAIREGDDQQAEVYYGVLKKKQESISDKSVVATYLALAQLKYKRGDNQNADSYITKARMASEARKLAWLGRYVLDPKDLLDLAELLAKKGDTSGKVYCASGALALPNISATEKEQALELGGIDSTTKAPALKMVSEK